MPKKDSITGCMVMTTGEFFQSEAEHEGKGRSGGELMSETLDEIAGSYEEEEKRWKENLSDTLSFLQKAVEEYNGFDPDPDFPPLAKPVSIEEVLDVQVGGSFRTSTLLIKARAKKEDSSEGTIVYKSWHSSGSYYEPPDGDVSIKWEN